MTRDTWVNYVKDRLKYNEYWKSDYEDIVADIRSNLTPTSSLINTNNINNTTNISKEDTTMTNSMTKNMTNTLTSLFHKLAPGQCRISMNGIAVKTSNGYKTFDPNTQTLVNCADFVFDMADDMFFCIPTNNVSMGDIIIASGTPVCVISVNGKRIEALRYEDSTVINIIPENIMFMGNTYFYSKVFSPFAGMAMNGNPNQFFQLMMMSEMMKGGESGGMGSMGSLMAMGMLMNGGFNFGDMFNGMFGSSNNTNNNSVNFTQNPSETTTPTQDTIGPNNG